LLCFALLYTYRCIAKNVAANTRPDPPTAAAAASVTVDGVGCVNDVDDVEELGELLYQRYPVDLCYNVLGAKWSLRYSQQKTCILYISK